MATIISFILILALLILVHELGHFVTAIKLGVDVEEFGIGFPPRLFSFKKGKVIYSVNLIPLGGFVKIKGEAGDHGDDPHSFVNQKFWKRASIISAGVLMNFVVAFVLLAVSFYFGLPQALDGTEDVSQVRDRHTVIAEILEDSPAQGVGLEVGDIIVLINNQLVIDAEMVSNQITESQGQEINLVVDRQGQEYQFEIQPQSITDSQGPIIGVGMVETGVIDYGFFASIWQGIKIGFLIMIMTVKAFYNLIVNLISHGQLDARLSGPVGVAVLTGEMVKLGWIYVLQFMAILSINLGIINFLPFPALDGGRILFLMIEKIRGRSLNMKLENWLHNSGFIILIVLIIFITFRDINRYSNNIMDFFKNLF